MSTYLRHSQPAAQDYIVKGSVKYGDDTLLSNRF